MKQLIYFTVLLMSLAYVPLSQGADVLDDHKKQLIDELLSITGTSKIEAVFARDFSQQITAAMKENQPDVNPKALSIVEEEIKAIINDEMVHKKSFNQRLYPSYHHHLSSDEIAELIRFYKTPVGKKFVEAMPAITQDTLKAGQNWGQTLVPRIQQQITARFEKEGIKITPDNTARSNTP